MPDEDVEARADPWTRNAQAIADAVFNPLLAELGFSPDVKFGFGPVTVTYTPYDPEREAFIDRVVELYREEHPVDPAQP